MNLHRESIQDRGQNRITREPKTAGEEVQKHYNLPIFGSRGLFVQWGSPSARREKPGRFILSNHVGRDLRFSENERGRQRSPSPCLDQVFDAGVHISDIFVIRSDFAILVTQGATSGKKTSIFGRWSIVRTLVNRFGWETGCDKFLSRHGSCSAFDSSHLFNSFTGKKI
jgi:hypothetical protein